MSRQCLLLPTVASRSQILAKFLTSLMLQLIQLQLIKIMRRAMIALKAGHIVLTPRAAEQLPSSTACQHNMYQKIKLRKGM